MKPQPLKENGTFCNVKSTAAATLWPCHKGVEITDTRSCFKRNSSAEEARFGRVDTFAFISPARKLRFKLSLLCPSMPSRSQSFFLLFFRPETLKGGRHFLQLESGWLSESKFSPHKQTNAQGGRSPCEHTLDQDR